MNSKTFQNDLLNWYDKHQRILPWRDNPVPYYVWISEIMLQQTKVETVIPYFNRFIEALPSIQELANIEEDKLLKLWEGLGYYNRARNLQKAAKIVVNQFHGVLPSTYEELIGLPGIGEYTAGAILSIAFNKTYTAVDGNVLRVFARILEIFEDIKDKQVKKEIKEHVASIIPTTRNGDFNQALMEIGAKICLPNGAPLCEICPLQSHCKSYQNKTTHLIPKKRKKKQVPTVQKTVLIIEQSDMFMIEQRPAKGLLASMYQFPLLQGHLSIDQVKEMYQTSEVKPILSNKHVFTHKIWEMKGYHIKLHNRIDGLFVSYDELVQTYSIPSAFKAYVSYIGGNK
jgi:A/G-specific adenine glycosylase